MSTETVPDTFSISKRTAQNKLRFDGLYRDGQQYLRFYEDGNVLAATFAKGSDSAAKNLLKSTKNVMQGTYTSVNSTIKFVTTGEQGSVEFEGTSAGDFLQLKWHSKINGRKGDARFNFEELPLAKD